MAWPIVKSAKALARDYQLPESDSRETHLNNFMAHIVSHLNDCFAIPGCLLSRLGATGHAFERMRGGDARA